MNYWLLKKKELLFSKIIEMKGRFISNLYDKPFDILATKNEMIATVFTASFNACPESRSSANAQLDMKYDLSCVVFLRSIL